jgi:hypothetical protein
MRQRVLRTFLISHREHSRYQSKGDIEVMLEQSPERYEYSQDRVRQNQAVEGCRSQGHPDRLRDEWYLYNDLKDPLEEE